MLLLEVDVHVAHGVVGLAERTRHLALTFSDIECQCRQIKLSKTNLFICAAVDNGLNGDCDAKDEVFDGPAGYGARRRLPRRQVNQERNLWVKKT